MDFNRFTQKCQEAILEAQNWAVRMNHTETDIEQSIIPLERFRKTIQTLGLNYLGQQVDITVSIGACQLTSEITTKEDFLQKADEALYEAKNSGRNKTVLSNC